MSALLERLHEWLGEVVAVDCASPYVAVGTLKQATAEYLELHDADMHDLRDTDSTREFYLVKTARHGVQANRKVLVLRMAEVVAVSPLSTVGAAG